MKRAAFVLSLIWVLSWVLAVPLPVLAFVARAGETVVFTESIADDLYIAGGTVEVVGTVEGDVAAAGGTVTVTGPVSGSLLATAGTLKVAGGVGRSLRAAAGNLEVGARVGTDAVVAGGNVNVERAAEIGRDLVAAGGSLQVSGTVERNAFLRGGNVVIGGTVRGDVHVQADRVILLPTVRISGRLRYAADQPAEIQSGAQISGGVERVARRLGPRRIYRPVPFRFAGRVLEALWLLAIGLVAMAVAPRGVARVANHVRSRFAMSLLTGFILLVVVPVAAVLVAITVIGIPLSAAVMLLYLATLYPAQIFVVAWLGGLILPSAQRDSATFAWRFLALVLGTIILVMIVVVPFVGWLVRLVALLVGFGALWATLWATRMQPQAPPPATP